MTDFSCGSFMLGLLSAFAAVASLSWMAVGVPPPAVVDADAAVLSFYAHFDPIALSVFTLLLTLLGIFRVAAVNFIQWLLGTRLGEWCWDVLHPWCLLVRDVFWRTHPRGWLHALRIWHLHWKAPRLLPSVAVEVNLKVDDFVSELEDYLNDDEAHGLTRDEILDYITGCLAVDCMDRHRALDDRWECFNGANY